MQKFTIFTIIFSVLVITITAELVVQDYLQKLYPPAEDLQANSLNTDNFEDFTKPSGKITSKIDEFLNEKNDEEDETDPIEPEDDLKPSPQDDEPSTDEVTRVQTVLAALDIDDVRYESSEYLGKLFQLLDTSAAPITTSDYGLFKVDQTTIGSVYQFKGKSEIDAETIYEFIKSKATAYPEISVNETGQFGESSFYINHIVKVAEVFVIFRQDNTVYAFAYKKDLHDKFKEFFNILV